MRTGHVRYLLVAALLTAGPACQSFVDPHDVVPVELDFGINRLQTEAAFMLAIKPDATVVRGYLLTPCQPYDASASARVAHETLVLRIVGRTTKDCSQDAVSSVGYQASVGIAPAAYSRIRVVHEWRDASWPDEVVVDTLLSQ